MLRAHYWQDDHRHKIIQIPKDKFILSPSIKPPLINLLIHFTYKKKSKNRSVPLKSQIAVFCISKSTLPKCNATSTRM